MRTAKKLSISEQIKNKEKGKRMYNTAQSYTQ